LERHLCHPPPLASPVVERWGPDLSVINNTSPTVVITTPTMGPCPLCRAQLSLFDLQKVTNKEAGGKGDDDEAGEYLYAKNYDLSPLQGSVYVDTSSVAVWQQRQARPAGEGWIGYGSFHFPERKEDDNNDDDDDDDDDDNKAEQPHDPRRPYFNIEHLPRWTHTDKRLPAHLFFADGAHYHAPTRTFCGTLPLDKVGGPFAQWDVYLSFSADLSMVRSGLINKRRRIPKSEQERMEWYPLDGWWTMVGAVGEEGREDDDDDLATRRERRRVHVVGNGFYDELGMFHMVKCQVESSDDDDETIPTNEGHSRTSTCTSPANKNVGIALMVHGGTGKRIFEATLPIQAITAGTSTEMAMTRSQGRNDATTTTTFTVIPPKVGETLIWKRSKMPNQNGTNDENNDDAEQETVIWRRESVSRQLPADEINQLGGSSGRIYQRWRAGSNNLVRTAPTYHADALWGNTFCQALRVGLASYHFVSEQEGAYISYEHPDTRQWPPLDNGMPVPSRVPFHDISFPDPRTFRGSICWQEEYGTTWQGMARWNYEMKFDPSFYCIVSGQVQCLLASGTEREMSRYGEDLVYGNAALFDHFQATAPSLGYGPYQQEHGSPASDDDDDVTSRINVDFIQDYHRGSEDLRRRLGVEAGASVRTLAMVRSIYSAARSAQPNPIDLNLLPALQNEES